MSFARSAPATTAQRLPVLPKALPNEAKDVASGQAVSLGLIPAEAAVGGIASSTKVKFTAKKVSGVELSTGSAASGGIGVFRLGDKIVIVTAASKATVLTIATALIKANH